MDSLVVELVRQMPAAAIAIAWVASILKGQFVPGKAHEEALAARDREFERYRLERNREVSTLRAEVAGWQRAALHGTQIAEALAVRSQ